MAAVNVERAFEELTALSAVGWNGSSQLETQSTVLARMAEVLASTLDLDRVGVWRTDGARQELRCAELYDRQRRRHASGAVLLRSHCPAYFRSLDEAAPVALEDGEVAGPHASDGYLSQHGVRSALILPISIASGVAGVIGYERVCRAGAWAPEEKLVALAASHLVSLVLSRWAHQSAEHQLRESREKYQELIDSLDAVVWEVKADDLSFTFVSEQAQRLFGYTPRRLLSTMTWRDLIHPDDRDFVVAYCRQATMDKQNHELEYRMLTADDRVIWVRDSASVVVEQGRPIKLRGVLFDITERKNLEDQLRLTQRVEAVGKLAGGIAHDFNNLVTIITGYSELLLNRLEPEDPARKDLEEIKKAGERAAGLTQQLLAFSRRQVLMPKVLNLNAVLTGMEAMLQRLIGEDIDLVSVQDPDLALVKADPGQMEQVIMNLVVNARDAMPRGGKLTIETKNIELRDSYRTTPVAIVPGRYVQLAVSDTGCGMPPEVQARIFEPFFTTKEPGKGTGLGLSTVYGIVKQSDGYIFVYSERGRGTTFKIYLPQVEGDVQPMVDREVPVSDCRGSETVLLVEDEPAVRALVRETLQQYGYQILEARHGYEALLIEQDHLSPIQLLISDVVMPQMSGREVADRLLARRPELKVLYISGYTEAAVVHHGVLDPGTAFLQKPFSPDQLVRKVRTVLDAERVAPGLGEES